MIPDIKYLLALMFAALFCFQASDAFAHPHVWVEAREDVLFNKDGLVTGIRSTWLFDEMYSAFAVQGLEKGGKLATPEDLAPLAQTNVDSLAEFDYFTFAKSGGVALKFGKPVDYTLSETPERRVVLRFTLPLKTPAKIVRFLTFQVYDPTYFVDFELAAKDPVVMSDAPSGCSQSVLGANPLVVQNGMKMAQSFDSGVQPSEDFALTMASRAVIACP